MARDRDAEAVTRGVTDVVSQWLCGTGTPQFMVGMHFNRKRNVLEVVVEQFVRPGGKLFLGDITLHVMERPDGDDSEGLVSAASSPDGWAHVLRLRGPREFVSFPCHSKVKRKGGVDAAADLLPDTHRKRGRDIGQQAGARDREKDEQLPLAKLTAMKIAVEQSASVRKPEEVNDTPVLWVRVDPGLAWLKRVSLLQPPVMSLTQLLFDEDTQSRLDAVNQLGALGCADAVWLPAGGYDMFPQEAFRYVPPSLLEGRESGVASDPYADARALLREQVSRHSTTVGYALTPRGGAWVPAKLAAVILDVDPTHAGSGGMDDPLRALLGEGSTRGAKPSAPVGFNLHVRCAAVHALVRWASNHLPALSEEEGSRVVGSPVSPAAVGAAGEKIDTWIGVAALLQVYKRLFFTAGDAHSTEFSLADEAVAPLSESRSGDVLATYASSGTTLPVYAASITDLELRRALAAGIGSLRHADGRVPLPALLLLTRVVREWDGSRLGALEGAHLLAGVVTALGSALLSLGEGCTPSSVAARPVVLDGVTALRETFALEMMALRGGTGRGGARPPPASGSGGVAGDAFDAGDDTVTAGTVLAAVVTSLAALEGCGLSAPVTLPLLPTLLQATHPTLGHPLPFRLRLACVVGLAVGFRSYNQQGCPYCDRVSAQAGRFIDCEDDLDRVLGWPDGDFRRVVDA